MTDVPGTFPSLASRPRFLQTAAPPRNSWLVPGILLLIVLSIPWWLAINYPFISFDDDIYVRNNPNVLSGLSPANIAWAFTTTHAALWQPLTWLSFMLDSTLFGTSTAGYHATNFILHTFNSILLYVLLARLTKSPGRSLFVAAFFAIHPLRVESVVWITERKDVLFTFFGLLSLICYARYAKAERRSGIWYAAALLLYIASLMAKVMLVTMPLLLLLIDWWPLERFSRTSWKRLLVEKIPYLVAAAAIALFTLHVLNEAHVPPNITLSYRLENTVLSYLMYLRDQFYFLDLSLVYPLGPPISPILVILTVLLFILVTASLIYLCRKRRAAARPLLFGWLFFIIAVAPVSGISQAGSQSRADRFTYLPSIGIAIILAWLIPDALLVAVKARRYAAAAASAGIAVLVVYCTLRILLWADPLKLYLDGLARTGPNPLMESNVGWALFESGKFDDSLDYYRLALSHAPDSDMIHFGYSHILHDAGQIADSYRELEIAHRLAPWNPEITDTYDRAMAYLQRVQAQTRNAANPASTAAPNASNP